MAVFKCASCGADLEVFADSDIAFCPYCGTKQTLPKDPVNLLTDGTTTKSLLRRGFMLLEDGEYSKADRYFDRVLDAEPENGRAYLGKLMACLEVTDKSQIQDALKDSRSDHEKIDRAHKLALRVEEFAPDELGDFFTMFYAEAGTEPYDDKLHHQANQQLLDAESKALALVTDHFAGSYSDTAGMNELRDSIRDIVNSYRDALGKLKDANISEDSLAYEYNSFAFSLNQLVMFIEPTYIDYVDADPKSKTRFLDDVHAVLDEANRFIAKNAPSKKPKLAGTSPSYHEQLTESLKTRTTPSTTPKPAQSVQSGQKPFHPIITLIEAAIIAACVYFLLRH